MFALVLDGEDHDFVAGEAVPLLLGHFQDEGDQLLHMHLEDCRHFVSEYTSGAVDLSNDVACLSAGQH